MSSMMITSHHRFIEAFKLIHCASYGNLFCCLRLFLIEDLCGAAATYRAAWLHMAAERWMTLQDGGVCRSLADFTATGALIWQARAEPIRWRASELIRWWEG